MQMHDLRKVRRVSVVEDAAEHLTRRIIAGEWSPGSAIPSLKRLAVELGISLLTVKEAIRVLQVNGLVESRHGSGTYVLSTEPLDKTVPWMLTPTDAQEYQELIEARRVIEHQIIKMALDRCTTEQLAKLTAIVEMMEGARQDAPGFLEADLEFHVALAEAAQNRILLRTMLAIRGPLKRYIAGRTAQHLKEKGNLDEAIQDHRSIVEGIQTKNPKLSHDGMERMIVRGEQHLETLLHKDKD